MNKSSITPVGLSVLVYPDQVDEQSSSGIFLGTPEQIEREQLKQTDGVVVAIGPLAWHDETDQAGEVIPRCKVGDRIVMTAYAGMVRKGKDEQMYRLIRDTDVIGILEK